jgi:hypothetical protein
MNLSDTSFISLLKEMLLFRNTLDYESDRGCALSPIEIKPATDYRNDPASEFYVRCFKERGIFLSNKPDSNNL